MLKAVIFDMDGVIINSEQIYRKIELELAASMGIKLSEEEQENYAGVYLKRMWIDLAKRFDLLVDAEAIVEKKRKQCGSIIKMETYTPFLEVQN